MAASFAAYASQFLNRQQTGASSLSSSQPLFYSFSTDNGSHAGNPHEADLDDLDDDTPEEPQIEFPSKKRKLEADEDDGDGDDDSDADAWTLVTVNEGMNEGKKSIDWFSRRKMSSSLIQRLQLYKLRVTSLQG